MAHLWIYGFVLGCGHHPDDDGRTGMPAGTCTPLSTRGRSHLYSGGRGE